MKNHYKDYFILIFLSLIWGSSFKLMDKGMMPFEGNNTYSDTQVAALRLFIAFIVLLPFVYRSIKQINRSDLVPLFIVGILGNGIPSFLFTNAQISLESSFVGALNSLTPIFTLLIGIYFFQIRSNIKNILGVIIALSGAILLYFAGFKGITVINIPVLLVLLATLCYGISINVIRRYLRRLDSISIASISFLFIGPFAGYYIFTTDFLEIAKTEDGLISLGYIFILAVFCTSFAVIIFNKLVKNTSAIFAASVTYLIPIVALFWGILDDEFITNQHLVGMLIILSGVYLVNKRK